MPENAPHVSSGLVFGRHIRMFLPASCPQRPGSRAIFAPAFILLAALSGCRSAYVQASVENDTDQPVSLIEVDYPEASFGTQTLAAHAAYPYRFKIQGSGQVSITFTGADGRNHAEKGPILRQGQEGRLGIHIEPGNRVSWSERLMQQR